MAQLLGVTALALIVILIVPLPLLGRLTLKLKFLPEEANALIEPRFTLTSALENPDIVCDQVPETANELLCVPVGTDHVTVEGTL